jgi:dihydrosphingosine 1-phosphate phosphatase
VSKLEEYESQMGTVSPRVSPDVPAQTTSSADVAGADEEEMFSMIKKPRVRYDVEVVTRLIVYMGKITFHLGS